MIKIVFDDTFIIAEIAGGSLMDNVEITNTHGKKISITITSENDKSCQSFGIVRLESVKQLNPTINFYQNFEVEFDGFFLVGKLIIKLLYDKMESYGYEIPYEGKDGHRIRPDQAIDKRFFTYLQERNEPNLGRIRSIVTKDEKGKDLFIHYYSYDFYSLFEHYFKYEWLVYHSVEYFRRKDKDIWPFLREYVIDIMESTDSCSWYNYEEYTT